MSKQNNNIKNISLNEKYKNARCEFKWRMQICAKLLYLNCI